MVTTVQDNCSVVCADQKRVLSIIVLDDRSVFGVGIVHS